MTGWLLLGALFALLICFGARRTKLTAIRALDSAFALVTTDDEARRRALGNLDAPPLPTNPRQRVKRYVSPFTAKRVAARQHFKCNLCRRELDETWETDHRVPLWMGGSNEASNLQALCRSCHISKSAEEASRG